MQSFKHKLLDLPNRLALNYRLMGSPLFVGSDLIFKLLGHLAYSNGAVLTKLHLKQLEQEIKDWCSNQALRIQAEQSFREGAKLQTADFELSLRKFNQSKLGQEILLLCCWRMIWADRHLGVREYQLVHLWGFWLGWGRPDIEQLGVAFRPIYISTAHRDALVLLDVEIKSKPSHIKKMYKRKLSSCHPDKLIGRGASPSEIEDAHKATIKVHEAYTLIRMLHGF